MALNPYKWDVFSDTAFQKIMNGDTDGLVALCTVDPDGRLRYISHNPNITKPLFAIPYYMVGEGINAIESVGMLVTDGEHHRLARPDGDRYIVPNEPFGLPEVHEDRLRGIIKHFCESITGE